MLSSGTIPRAPAPAALLSLAALLAAPALAGCGEAEREDRAADVDSAAGETTSAGAAPDTRPAESGAQEAEFVVRDAVLYRRTAEGRRPLLALDSAAAPAGVPVVPATWSPAPDAAFRIGASDLSRVVPSPTGRRVAWQTESIHRLVGVVGADGERLSVLDFYFDSSARDLTWAPAGRYLAARYLPPSGMEEVRVYDAEAGTRLGTPWGEGCRPQSGCRVTSAEWTGPTTLRVITADGEERRHEVDVSGLSAATPEGK